MIDHEQEIRRLGRARWRLAGVLTALMMGSYFGFLGLVAYQKEWLGSTIVAGLSWGIVLGAGLIVFAWVLTFVYVQWANNVFDKEMKRLREATK